MFRLTRVHRSPVQCLWCRRRPIIPACGGGSGFSLATVPLEVTLGIVKSAPTTGRAGRRWPAMGGMVPPVMAGRNRRWTCRLTRGSRSRSLFTIRPGTSITGGGPGWFVDNVTLVTGAITTLTANVPVDFESGLGDWSVDNGFLAGGNPPGGPGAAYAGTNCAGARLPGSAPA